ncbi:hypothetical protein WDZ17_12885 [Pseudokineococcus basanitobsidens]|uniref:Uncharacterized protein n=1 Tax=Pseudokineococcus basanitobsidens TaxID=1926649 RepID=A0ABU8RM95_9ACTN
MTPPTATHLATAPAGLDWLSDVADLERRVRELLDEVTARAPA